MLRLFIAEKPSLAKAIASGLGKAKSENGYLKIGEDIVTWCYGHILEQYEPDDYDPKYKNRSMNDLPIVPIKWRLKVKKEAETQFNIIKDLINKADYIVNAGDPDREGQLLIDEVLEYVNNKKPVKRILINALDEKSIHEALNDLRDNSNFVGLKNSALARSRADWLIGMNLSRAFTIKAHEAGYGALNVGRVLTPTMALVVRRENEIKGFKSVIHYQSEIMWQHENGFIQTYWKPKDDANFLDSEDRILDRSSCEELIKCIRDNSNNAYIKEIEQKKKQEGQLLPYSLSALQIDAGKKFGYNPKEVLDTMQELYEKKLTTYPRSDCTYLPENQLADAREILANLKSIPNEQFSELVDNANISIRSRAWNDKKISAHHALIPTRIKCNFEELTTKQQNLYMMLAQSYLAQFYPVYTYTSTKITISCDDELFVGNGKVILDLGWRRIYKNNEKKDEPILPSVMENDSVSFIGGKIATKQTKPPSRFTPSTLLKAMKEIYKYVRDERLKNELKECSGIGTEATRAGIIEKLQAIDFVKFADKNLVPTDKAYMAIQILPEDLTYPDTTAILENALENIADDEFNLDEFFSRQIEFVDKIINDVKGIKIKMAQDAVVCPKCGKAMRKTKGAKGYFWSCSGYPECRTTASDNNGKADFTIKNKTASAVCPKCGKKMYQRKGPYSVFWSCEDRECGLLLSDNKNKPVIVKCPKCQVGYLTKKNGVKGLFWSCNQFPKCKSIFKDMAGEPLVYSKK